MKKMLFSLFIGIVFFGLCSVQNVSAQTTDAQRAVGTWRIEDGDRHFQGTLTINANGTYVLTNPGGRTISSGQYFFSNNRLIIRIPEDDIIRVCEYYFSADGRIIVFNYGEGNKWLIKQ